MFTRDFRKPALAIAALLLVASLYATLVLAGSALASWAEREQQAFPFKHEDWLRYLLPSSVIQGDGPRIMIAGSSTVRENFVYSRFAEAFPRYTVFQGGFSLATIEDSMVALEYLEKVYGPEALPEIMVLGTSPRYIANIPEERPFAIGIDRYSPYFSVEQQSSGMKLVPKGLVEGLAARARFLGAKQPERYRTALQAAANYALSKNIGGMNLAGLFDRSAPAGLLRSFGYSAIVDLGLSGWLEYKISPYKHATGISLPDTALRQRFTADSGWWYRVHAWDPNQDKEATLGRLKKFMDFVREHDIQLLVVNMPEREVSRAFFDEANYRAYLDQVRLSIGESDFVDLREFLDSEMFHDSEHTLPAGSRILTDEVIRHLQATLNPATQTEK